LTGLARLVSLAAKPEVLPDGTGIPGSPRRLRRDRERTEEAARIANYSRADALKPNLKSPRWMLVGMITIM
jgi:hypothetical protein